MTSTQTVEALRKLAAEVGVLKAFDPGVREAIGNTNWTVLMQRLDEAVAALSRIVQAPVADGVREAKPMAAMEGTTLPEALAHVDLIWPGSFWLLGKGKLSSAEPLFGFQVLFGADEVLAEGEGETAVEAIYDAIAKATARTLAGGSDA